MMKAVTQKSADVVLDAIRSRRSIREFTGAPVSDETVRTIIGAGIEAPTGMGIQPWRFVVVRDARLMEEISDFCKPILARSLEGVTDETARTYRQLLEDPGFDIFHHAPVLVIVAGDKRDPMSVYDCSLCAGNMLLAASAMGLGRCWIGSAEVVQEHPELMARLRIPDHFRIIAPLIFGHPAAEPEKPGRREASVTWIP
jgi:nitroreductase